MYSDLCINSDVEFKKEYSFIKNQTEIISLFSDSTSDENNYSEDRLITSLVNQVIFSLHFVF